MRFYYRTDKKDAPMEKNSTHVLTTTLRNGIVKDMPRKSTIEFLKQFARAYSYSRKLPAGLGGFVAN
jgi:hypothetical protein